MKVGSQVDKGINFAKRKRTRRHIVAVVRRVTVPSFFHDSHASAIVGKRHA